MKGVLHITSVAGVVSLVKTVSGSTFASTVGTPPIGPLSALTPGSIRGCTERVVRFATFECLQQFYCYVIQSSL